MTVTHRVEISRMYYQLEFGHMKENGKINPNTGDEVKEFVPEFVRWAGKWNISQTMMLQLNGANIKEPVVFYVRHESGLTSDYTLRLDGNIYQIDNISYDESQSMKAFDLITCHREIVKHG